MLTVMNATWLVCSILISVDYRMFAVCSTNKLTTDFNRSPTNFTGIYSLPFCRLRGAMPLPWHHGCADEPGKAVDLIV